MKSVDREPTPEELQLFESNLLDEDGTCRDLNFEGGDREDLARLVDLLLASFDLLESKDLEGEPLAEPLGKSLVAAVAAGSSAHLVFHRGRDFLSRVQLSADGDEPASPGVEITFFPDELVPRDNLGRDFLAWARDLARALGARRFFVRYEDGSWRLKDPSTHGSAFWISELGDGGPSSGPT